MSAITTHVLDTARGRPAGGVRVTLERSGEDGAWRPIGQGETDADGRLRTLMPEGGSPAPGIYRLLFDTRAYFDALGLSSFYPQIVVTFQIQDEGHHHLPLLVSPFGYTTYRGS